jgi:hypothetical protein
VIPLAAAAALALWIARSPEIPSTVPETMDGIAETDVSGDPTTLAAVEETGDSIRIASDAPGDAMQLATAGLGVYTTPTDVLLEIDGFDPLDGVPGYDCEEAGLGCPDLGAGFEDRGRSSWRGLGGSVTT